MAYVIDNDTADRIKNQALDIVAQMTAYQALIVLNSGNPVDWSNVDRQDILKDCTLMVFQTGLMIACYPLSVSAVVFV